MFKNTPKISVIMPFYNCERYLGQAIESILTQTFNDFELILINDASTDNSDSIAKRYLNDQRVVYIKNNYNKKIVKNLNLGLSIARAEIIARMDGDDISHPDRLEKQYSYLLAHKVIVLIGSFAELIDSNGRVVGQMIKPTSPEMIKKTAFYYAPFVHPAIMIRRGVLEAVGCYREKYLFCEDIDLFFRVIFSGYQTCNIPEFLIKYRQHNRHA